MFWVGFLIGLFIGVNGGAVAMGLACASKDADRQREQQLVESCLWVHEFDQNGMHVRTTAKISPYEDSEEVSDG